MNESSLQCDTLAHRAAAGDFISRSHMLGHRRRDYKLFIPTKTNDEPMPLLVMLHGCKQDPDDFAAGTRMNDWAQREGFLVVYPSQPRSENCNNCWNWFDSRQQTRDGGEPVLIVGIVKDIMNEHPVDAARIFVAGLSAGAAMAVILGSTYPDLFAGVAAHSGLPAGAASNMLAAVAAMQGRKSVSTAEASNLPVPTIVFHGDADPIVNLSNGATIVEQALQGSAACDIKLGRRRVEPGVHEGIRFTRAHHTDEGGRHRIEEWIVHGGEHAWFGGCDEGSFTDPSGPDASAEIVRFFLELPPHRSSQASADADERSDDDIAAFSSTPRRARHA
ncbi:PHB depolymerase family esterase [Paucibacter sp. R3-3]|uniref:PHB depolymerase family esterase n=1 Tax=Roseateles agri TaxID=3098619 RepID=A0ABU5DMM5_9BURK|nr:PHB depolymerase family esterase [Paucibacter sp. R3-3]MDY0747566.1 PHB depolymerase family esterase [Paucibacter sp. R3-3]